MFDGILFDLDGTLWDSVSGVTKIWNIGILEEKVDRAPLTEEDVRAGMGKTLPDIAAILFPMLERPRQLEVMDRCCQVENEYLAKNGAYVFPGVEETLKTLSAQCPLFVVSNCQSGYIEAFFAGTGLGKYFAGLECAGNTGKPKSENIALVCRREGLKNPVYVGDTLLDCQSAREAGVPFVHAAYGFGKVEGVPAVHSFPELPQVLAELSK